jgi:uncharacterized RDD family membrane protein YckC/predicted  nucleic acid-binding Zn-ribbon protein
MKCVKCGKEQAEKSLHCVNCGERLFKDGKDLKDQAEALRPTLLEFPAAAPRSADKQTRSAASMAAAYPADWRAELSERVRQVKERRNLQEARTRLQAELEAAAQRYQQTNAPAPPAQPLANLKAAMVATEPMLEVDIDRHPNPIIDAALRRARRASEAAGKKQLSVGNLAAAAAPKIPPQVQTQPVVAKPKPAPTAMVEAEKAPSLPVFDLSLELMAQDETLLVSRIEPAIVAPPPPAPLPPAPLQDDIPITEMKFESKVIENRTIEDTRARLMELENFELPKESRPVRVIRECDDGPNYLDELIAVCEQNLTNEYARYSQRLIAGIFDLFVIALSSGAFWATTYAVGVNLLDHRVLYLLSGATLVIALLYLTFTLTFVSRTFGMTFVGTRVIHANTGMPPSFFQSFLRSFGYILALAPAGLGYVSMFIDREHRGLHDIISGTSVIRDY